MKILVAGATGAVGRRLVPVLVGAGHRVFATTRTRAKLESLRALGAQPVMLDGLDAAAVARVVDEVGPEVIVHEMTALSSARNLRRIDDELAVTNRLRTEGTRYLLDAARAVGTRLFVAQSFTGWPNARDGGRVKVESDPLDSKPAPTMRKSLEAIVTLESMVLAASVPKGIVLRYGALYGPGTSIGAGGEVVEMVRKRRFPIVGDGAGVWSFLHIDDAASATAVAIERAVPGLYNIVDDEPIEVNRWLPELARAIGARPPLHVPKWVGRLLLGEPGLAMMTNVRGSSNDKARRVLEWKPHFATVRDGFYEGLSDERISSAA